MIHQHDFIDFIPVPVFICDKTTIYSRNSAFDKIIKSNSSLITECLQGFKDEDLKLVMTKLNRALVGEIAQIIEHAHLEINNQLYNVSVYIEGAVIDGESRAVVMFKDSEINPTLHQASGAKHKLINQEKLAGIGHLAAGVAHEIFNPLGYIKSNFDTLNQYFSDLAEIVVELKKITADHCKLEAIEKIEGIESKYDLDFILDDINELFADVDEGMNRVLNIVNGLKRFAHESDDIIDYDLNEGLQSTLTISKNEFKYNAQMNVIYGDIPTVKAHSSKINQVILGMIVNAVYAIKEKHKDDMGTLDILTFTESGHVCCKICDNGIGIPQEKVKDIFNPFYTSKPEGVGTGLGLSIAWDIIVEQHGGRLEVESEYGEGTCFTFRLPLTDELG